VSSSVRDEPGENFGGRGAEWTARPRPERKGEGFRRRWPAKTGPYVLSTSLPDGVEREHEDRRGRRLIDAAAAEADVRISGERLTEASCWIY
jgi:hypothetical protein